MADFLFVTWDGGGNVPPAIAVAHELQAHGHQVRFLGHASQEKALTEAGLSFVRPQHARQFDGRVPHSPLEMMATFGDKGMGRDLLDALEQQPADLVVIDCLMIGAMDAARRSGVRYAVLEHMYDEYVRRVVLGGPMGGYFRLRRLPPRPAIEGAALRIVATLPELDPVPADPRIAQVGPIVPAATPAESWGDPMVLVSLSTFGFRGMEDCLQRVVDATGDLPARVVVTTGPVIDPGSLRLPARVEAHRFVPHAELMPQASLVVGHGGHGTTMTALAHGLPAVVMPMDRNTDQPAIGRSLVSTGAGSVLAKKAPPEEIAPVLHRFLVDGPHRPVAARLGAAIRESDAAVAAAGRLAGLVGVSDVPR